MELKSSLALLLVLSQLRGVDSRAVMPEDVGSIADAPFAGRRATRSTWNSGNFLRTDDHAVAWRSILQANTSRMSAFAVFGGTAFPICFTTSSRLPVKT